MVTDLVFGDDAAYFFKESMAVLLMDLKALHEKMKFMGFHVSCEKPTLQMF